MQLDGMIFDLDGTLTDTFSVCFVAFREALYPFTGRHFSDEEILAQFGPSEEGMLQRWLPDRWEECLPLYLAAYERAHRRIARTFPSIDVALDLLHERGIRLAVVTGKGRRSAAISLAQLGLTPHFDCVETGAPEGSVKPLCIQRVLERWGAPPNRVAYLGDVPSDVEASRAVGVVPLAAAWETRSDANALRALGPLAVFDAVPEFIQWIRDTVEPSADRAPRAATVSPAAADPSRHKAGG